MGATAETCYACSAPATTREHVPPRCLFPETKDLPEGLDLRRNLLTVPSCELHNTGKSPDDEYFLWVVCCSLTTNKVGQRQLYTKLLRALRRDASTWLSFESGARDVLVTDSESGRQHEATMCPFDGARFQRTLELIARGIYFAHFRETWLGPLKVHADFVDAPDEPNQATLREARLTLFRGAKQVFATATWHGANQDVFRYAVHEPDERFRALVRLVFYGACTATAFFRAEPQG
jgi:hypothetical protein